MVVHVLDHCGNAVLVGPLERNSDRAPAQIVIDERHDDRTGLADPALLHIPHCGFALIPASAAVPLPLPFVAIFVVILCAALVAAPPSATP